MKLSIRFAFVLTALAMMGCGSGGSSSGTPGGGNQPPAQTAPAAPTGLAATPGDTQVVLTWAASASATAYHVKRAGASGGPYTEVDTATGTTYTDTGLANGTNYYYVVTASNTAGTSGNSNEASATPTAVSEVHPTLVIGSADIPVLAARLGDAHLGDSQFSQALEGCLRGQRAGDAVTWLMDWVSHVEATGNYTDVDPYRWTPDYALICDLQWKYLTADEQVRARTVLLDASEAIYQESITNSIWYFADECINNWVINHMTDYYLQRMLYPALMFPDDPRSAASRDRAIGILRAWWDRCPGAITGGAGEMIDETLTCPNGYGLWDLNDFAPILIALSRNTNFDPYSYAGSLFHNEGIYRTYVLGFWEGDSDNHTCFSKAGYVGAGHGEGGPLIYYTNADLLQLAYVYNDPVLAYHYYQNPAPCRRDSYADYLSDWNTLPPPTGWENGFGNDGLRYLLYWGRVAPVSPDAAGWPLSKHFQGAGVAVMRKSWNKHDGLIWFRGGYGGSHYQPSQGTVNYQADDAVILGNGGAQDYSPDSRMNNVLLVDGSGQVDPYPDLPPQRQSYGMMTRIDDDTYEAALDAAYTDLSSGVSWTRTVHYDRGLDILEINDAATTTDGLEHDLAFNWVTEPAIVSNDKIQLPGTYLMLIRSGSTFTSQVVNVQPSTADQAFNTLLVTGHGHGMSVSWYIGKNESQLLAYINAH